MLQSAKRALQVERLRGLRSLDKMLVRWSGARLALAKRRLRKRMLLACLEPPEALGGFSSIWMPSIWIASKPRPEVGDPQTRVEEVIDYEFRPSEL